MAAPERLAETSDSSCIAGAVHTWHFCDIPRSRIDFRFPGKSGHAADITGRTGFDPIETLAAKFAVVHNAAFLGRCGRVRCSATTPDRVRANLRSDPCGLRQQPCP